MLMNEGGGEGGKVSLRATPTITTNASADEEWDVEEEEGCVDFTPIARMGIFLSETSLSSSSSDLPNQSVSVHHRKRPRASSPSTALPLALPKSAKSLYSSPGTSSASFPRIQHPPNKMMRRFESYEQGRGGKTAAAAPASKPPLDDDEDDDAMDFLSATSEFRNISKPKPPPPPRHPPILYSETEEEEEDDIPLMGMDITMLLQRASGGTLVTSSSASSSSFTSIRAPSNTAAAASVVPTTTAKPPSRYHSTEASMSLDEESIAYSSSSNSSINSETWMGGQGRMRRSDLRAAAPPYSSSSSTVHNPPSSQLTSSGSRSLASGQTNYALLNVFKRMYIYTWPVKIGDSLIDQISKEVNRNPTPSELMATYQQRQQQQQQSLSLYSSSSSFHGGGGMDFMGGGGDGTRGRMAGTAAAALAADPRNMDENKTRPFCFNIPLESQAHLVDKRWEGMFTNVTPIVSPSQLCEFLSHRVVNQYQNRLFLYRPKGPGDPCVPQVACAAASYMTKPIIFVVPGKGRFPILPIFRYSFIASDRPTSGGTDSSDHHVGIIKEELENRFHNNNHGNATAGTASSRCDIRYVVKKSLQWIASPCTDANLGLLIDHFRERIDIQINQMKLAEEREQRRQAAKLAAEERERRKKNNDTDVPAAITGGRGNTSIRRRSIPSSSTRNTSASATTATMKKTEEEEELDDDEEQDMAIFRSLGLENDAFIRRGGGGGRGAHGSSSTVGVVAAASSHTSQQQQQHHGGEEEEGGEVQDPIRWGEFCDAIKLGICGGLDFLSLDEDDSLIFEEAFSNHGRTGDSAAAAADSASSASLLSSSSSSSIASDTMMIDSLLSELHTERIWTLPLIRSTIVSYYERKGVPITKQIKDVPDDERQVNRGLEREMARSKRRKRGGGRGTCAAARKLDGQLDRFLDIHENYFGVCLNMFLNQGILAKLFPRYPKHKVLMLPLVVLEKMDSMFPQNPCYWRNTPPNLVPASVMRNGGGGRGGRGGDSSSSSSFISPIQYCFFSNYLKEMEYKNNIGRKDIITFPELSFKSFYELLYTEGKLQENHIELLAVTIYSELKHECIKNGHKFVPLWQLYIKDSIKSNTHEVFFEAISLLQSHNAIFVEKNRVDPATGDTVVPTISSSFPNDLVYLGFVRTTEDLIVHCMGKMFDNFRQQKPRLKSDVPPTEPLLLPCEYDPASEPRIADTPLCSEQARLMHAITDNLTPFILVDGFGGAGKSTGLAKALRELIPNESLFVTAQAANAASAKESIFRSSFTIAMILMVHALTCPLSPQYRPRMPKFEKPENMHGLSEAEIQNIIYCMETKGYRHTMGKCFLSVITTIIFDEISLVNDESFAALIAAAITCGRLARLIVCGDHRQKPQISFGCLHADLLKAFPEYILDFKHCHRFESGILYANAESLYSGRYDLVQHDPRRFNVIDTSSYQLTNKQLSLIRHPTEKRRVLKEAYRKLFTDYNIRASPRTMVTTRTNYRRNIICEVLDELAFGDSREIHKGLQFFVKVTDDSCRYVAKQILIVHRICDIKLPRDVTKATLSRTKIRDIIGPEVWSGTSTAYPVANHRETFRVIIAYPASCYPATPYDKEVRIPYFGSHKHLLNRASCLTMHFVQGFQAENVVVDLSSIWSDADKVRTLVMVVTRGQKSVTMLSTHKNISDCCRNSENPKYSTMWVSLRSVGKRHIRYLRKLHDVVRETFLDLEDINTMFDGEEEEHGRNKEKNPFLDYIRDICPPDKLLIYPPNINVHTLENTENGCYDPKVILNKERLEKLRQEQEAERQKKQQTDDLFKQIFGPP